MSQLQTILAYFDEADLYEYNGEMFQHYSCKDNYGATFKSENIEGIATNPDVDKFLVCDLEYGTREVDLPALIKHLNIFRNERVF